METLEDERYVVIKAQYKYFLQLSDFFLYYHASGNRTPGSSRSYSDLVDTLADSPVCTQALFKGCLYNVGSSLGLVPINAQ